MSKPQHALPPGSNNGAGVASFAGASSVEPTMVDSEINKDAGPRPEVRISPDLSSMDIKNISLRKLLEHCLEQGEDQNAWDEFAKRVQPTIRGVVAKRLRLCRVKVADQLVGEVTQDAFVKLFKNNYRALRKDWADDLSIFKFIRVVAQSAVIDWLRRNKILKDADEFEDSHELRAGPAKNPAEQAILREQVDRCLQTQESNPNFKRDRAIFWLFYRYGYRDSEIAGLVNLPVKNVQNILQKYVRVARLKLRKDKGKDAPGE